MAAATGLVLFTFFKKGFQDFSPLYPNVMGLLIVIIAVTSWVFTKYYLKRIKR